MPTVITCTRRFQFAAGHRVYQHESKCRHLHGHNYIVHVTAQAPALDSVGRVIDFGSLKAAVGEWLERYWDHGFLIFGRDPLRRVLEELNVGGEGQLDHVPQKVYVMPYNPTAENMARFLLREVCPAIVPNHITVVQVRVQETENCEATATLGMASE